jgi:hypothetical protein
VSKGTVTLTWDAPDDGGKPIIEYDISWDANRDATPTFNEGPVQVFNGVGESAFFCGELHVRETVRVSSGQRASVTLSDLHPDASYTFYVRARNLLGSGAIAISNEVKTPALT